MTADKIKQALRLREGGAIERCHTVPHYRSYTTGQHTHCMLDLLFVLHPKASKKLMWAIHLHDKAERLTGDLPGNVINLSPELKAAHQDITRKVDLSLGLDMEVLDDEENVWLHCLDKLELYLWCQDELNMGNDHVANVLMYLDEWFENNRKTLPQAVVQFWGKFEWSRTDNNL